MNVKRLQQDFCRWIKSLRVWLAVAVALAAGASGALAQSTNLPSGLDFNSFRIIVERNIFNQSRMPHERAVQPARVPDSFSLVGTLFYAEGDIAFFNGSGSEYRKALKVGGDIAGFKVVAMTLSSVTLSDGTNQTVLNINTQMRRDDAGHWSVSTEPATYSSAGSASSSSSRRTHSHRSSYTSNSTRRNFTTTGTVAQNAADNGSPPPGMEGEPPPDMEENPPEAPASPGGANSALERLMQRRAQEEQRLNQGQ